MHNQQAEAPLCEERRPSMSRVRSQASDRPRMLEELGLRGFVPREQSEELQLPPRMVAPPTVSAPDKLSAEPVTEDERITAELNVAVTVTFTPESISAVVTTIFADVRVSPEDPSIKSRVWERKALRELFTSEGAIPSPMLIPSISVLSPGVAEYSEYRVRGII